jgi:hypothetical protein
MQANHRYELQNRIEAILESGHSSISRAELLRWFAQSRLSKTVWREILNIWIGIGGNSSDIKVWEGNDAYHFIYPADFINLQDWT